MLTPTLNLSARPIPVEPCPPLPPSTDPGSLQAAQPVPQPQTREHILLSR